MHCYTSISSILTAFYRSDVYKRFGCGVGNTVKDKKERIRKRRVMLNCRLETGEIKEEGRKIGSEGL